MEGAEHGYARPEDEEANGWAANFLVPRVRVEAFMARFDGSAHAVVKFAASKRISPGIVVGQFQKSGAVPFNHLTVVLRQTACREATA